MKYLQRILLSLLGILILVFIGYQIFRGTTYSNVKTETAIYGTLWNTVSVKAAAVRDETLLSDSPAEIGIRRAESFLQTLFRRRRQKRRRSQTVA